jgi:hypothetical protein
VTPADLRAITISLDDERGTGGQIKFARLLDWDYSTLRRKLNGKSPITESDALAIQKAVETAEEQSRLARRTRVLVQREMLTQ